MNQPPARDFVHRGPAIQHEPIPQLIELMGTLTPQLEGLIHNLEWLRGVREGLVVRSGATAQ